MRVYALTNSQSVRETLDLFLTREAAEAELREILEDEPDWKDVLRVVPIEFDGRQMSLN
jgi:Mn-containing catalase